VEGLRNIERLRIGLRFEAHDYGYLELADGGLLQSGEFIGVSASGETGAGAGLTWDYDSRDDRYAPTSGWRVRGKLMGFNLVTSGRSGFLSTSLDVRTYLSTSPRNVFALQAFTFDVNADAPIWRYAAIGGREHTRGYSRNRYLDQRLLAAQVEWRRHLYRRVGLQVFGGSALVSPSWGKLQVRYHRPTIGAGLSVVIPQVSNTAIRGDLAFGDESVHARLALGLAF
jgi:outer membrane protein assembly factor BamA